MDSFEFRRRGDAGIDPEIEDLATKVIGAAIEVRRELGPGLPESSYKRALSRELDLRGIGHACEVPVRIVYKGAGVGERRIDVPVEKRLVVELKAVESLNAVHRAQALTYLRVMSLPLALVINFNVAILKDGIKRVINTTI